MPLDTPPMPGFPIDVDDPVGLVSAARTYSYSLSVQLNQVEFEGFRIDSKGTHQKAITRALVSNIEASKKLLNAMKG